MCKAYERPPLVLSEGMKLFAVNAGYRKTDVGTNWYWERENIRLRKCQLGFGTAL